MARHRKRGAHAAAGYRSGNARRLAAGIRTHPSRADVRGREDVPAIYARHLSADDMRVLAAFYGTSTGTRMLQAMPKVLPEAFASVLPRMQSMLADTQDSFLKLLRERGLLN